MSSEDKNSNNLSQLTPPSSRPSVPSKKASFLTIVKAQIAVLLSTLSDSTYSRSVTEIFSVTDLAHRHVEDKAHWLRL
jgi:hypothetical protein